MAVNAREKVESPWLRVDCGSKSSRCLWCQWKKGVQNGCTVTSILGGARGTRASAVRIERTGVRQADILEGVRMWLMADAALVCLAMTPRTLTNREFVTLIRRFACQFRAIWIQWGLCSTWDQSSQVCPSFEKLGTGFDEHWQSAGQWKSEIEVKHYIINLKQVVCRKHMNFIIYKLEDRSTESIMHYKRSDEGKKRSKVKNMEGEPKQSCTINCTEVYI